MKKRIRVGIVGCGAIGSYLAKTIASRFRGFAVLEALTDLRPEKAAALIRKLKTKVRILNQEDLVRCCDLVIEAASAKAVGPVVRKVLHHRKRVLVMSVGGLISDPALLKQIQAANGSVFVPSGALTGIDGLLAARMGKIKKVSLVTRKPPRAFSGVPFLKERKINLDNLTKEKLLFSGPAIRAVKAFPQNINVAAVLSLAGIGPAKTQVRIYAVPSLKKNVHRVEIEGDFGRMVTQTENVPAPGNSKTSYLAALAPAAMLKKIFGTLQIGT